MNLVKSFLLEHGYKEEYFENNEGVKTVVCILTDFEKELVKKLNLQNVK